VNEFARLKKGPAWEFRVHRAMFASGWYVRRNIDLRERVEGAPQVMAEIDMLGISFDAGLAARRIIAECKDRRGSGQEADRVIWLLGLGHLLHVDTLMLAKPRISAATVRFARSTSVALFEEASVNQIEARLNGPRLAGSFDIDTSEDLIAPSVSRKALADNRLREAYDWIHNGSWTEDPVARVRRLPGYFRLILQQAKNDTRKVLLIEGFLGLLACSLQMSGMLRRHSPNVARALAADALASGAAPAIALKEIAASADDFYRNAFEQASEEQTGKRLMLTAPRLAEHIANPPRWADAFFAMSETIGSRPEAATDVLRYADLTLHERFAGREPGPAQRAFIRGDHTWLAGTLALAAGFCIRVWGLDEPFFTQLTTGTDGDRTNDEPQAAKASARPNGDPGRRAASGPDPTDTTRRPHQDSLMDGAQLTADPSAE
jgi:hypothetical protein